MRVKFYTLEVGDHFTLPDTDDPMVKTWDDHAVRLSSNESVLVNPDDTVVVEAT